MVFRASRLITLYFTLFSFSCAVMYLLAVGVGHVAPFIPNLNYLGDLPRESTLFTLLFGCVSCILSFITQIQFVCNTHFLEKNKAQESIVRANTVSAYVGQLAVLGLFITSCFQECHACFCHYFGRVLYLGGSIVYFSLQTSISVNQKDPRSNMRATIDVLLLVFAVVWSLSFVSARLNFDKTWDRRLHWSPRDGGWNSHVVNAFSEWIIILLNQLYIFTFYPDFERTMITKTSIVVLPEELE